jgi:predicted choloylglycine hydrolase
LTFEGSGTTILRMDTDQRHWLGRSSHRETSVTFRSIGERLPGPAWRSVFEGGWPGWSEWLGDRAGGPAELRSAERALRRHMPELAPVWERLVEVAGGDPRAARFLTFWSPPRYLLHCSQAAIVDDEGPLLIRNYDLDPGLNEGFLYRSEWLGRPVVGMVDGLSGLADGMNGAGLAISLAYGGRVSVGPGFGVPMILRYVLEVCRDTVDAVEALRALPCHMSYTLTMIDRGGRHATVLMAPDRPAIVREDRHATNHQLGVEWPWHGRLSRTVERAEHLAVALGHHQPDGAALRRLFFAPPLHVHRYAAGFGTVYTALYRPAAGTVEIAWPGIAPLGGHIDALPERRRRIVFRDGETPHEAPATAHPHHADFHAPGPVAAP